MWVKHLSSLQFLTYVAFFAVVVAAICKFVPGKAAPVREEPYPDDELYAHDRKTAKYFVAGGLFLVLGSVHTAVKNLPWLAEYLARTGYAGHLVRDLSNTHVTIVGGGTLLATGLCWLALPRIVGRPLASEGLAGCAALAVGTLQGPVQALPLVNEALDRGGQAGDVIVNLHAQLNMVGGLMMLLVGLALGALELSGAAWPVRRARLLVPPVPPR